MISFFDPPTWGYNVVSFIATVLGCVAGIALGCCGLWIAYVQLKRIATATEATRVATAETHRRVYRLATVVDLHRLISLTGELVVCLRYDDRGGAVVRAKDVRAGLAALSNSPEGRPLASDGDWGTMHQDIADVQRKLEAATGVPPRIRVACLAAANPLDEKLHRMAGSATRFDGA